jgi:neutral ceramidase
VAWPGEIFVEYGLALKQRVENSFLITCANGELQGYIVTREADERRSYEAGNSLFHYTAGEIMSRETVELLNEWEV